MAHVRDFVSVLVARAGTAYRFGAEVSGDDPNPPAFDCSEYTEWGSKRIGLVPPLPDGSWLQYRYCHQEGTTIPIPTAVTTPGALLFRFSDNPLSGPRPSSAHVAVSLGDGRTIEARSTKDGTGIFSAAGRGWTHAALVPHLDYSAEDPTQYPDAKAWAVANGITNGVRPRDPVSREESWVMLKRLDALIRRQVG